MTVTERHEEILAVEDDDAQARLLRRVLESAGFQVHTERTGLEALKYAAQHPVALAILDLRLPDIDGFSVCEELRKRYDSWAVPVVMVTGLDRPIDQVHGYRSGADVYLTKPYNVAELLQIVGSLLHGPRGSEVSCGCYW
ncbi:MAG: response regulator [Candidatus Omnitrophica bacterium]|nr:response regulator [Candidatus Omnitrophota bacterium]